MNYALLAAYIYDTTPESSDSTHKLRYVIKGGQEGSSDPKLTSFRNLLRFREGVPHLVRLLRAGGIWTLDCENAYGALVKCRVEQVC